MSKKEIDEKEDYDGFTMKSYLKELIKTKEKDKHLIIIMICINLFALFMLSIYMIIIIIRLL